MDSVVRFLCLLQHLKCNCMKISPFRLFIVNVVSAYIIRAFPTGLVCAARGRVIVLSVGRSVCLFVTPCTCAQGIE